jgi:hypothetical protein
MVTSREKSSKSSIEQGTAALHLTAARLKPLTESGYLFAKSRGGLQSIIEY